MPRRAAASDHLARLSFAIATEADAPAIAALLNAAADHLATVHGPGPWSGHTSERSVLLGILPPVAGVRRSVTARVLIARTGRGRSARIVGTLRLSTKKPWSIDVSYFTTVDRALYLTGMAVEPRLQGQGIGRRMLEQAARAADEFPTTPAAQSIRLDAYETSGSRALGAGAGEFYAKCGYRHVGRIVYRGIPLAYYELLL